MNCIRDGKYTGDSCFGCNVKVEDCEIRDKIYRNRWISVSEQLPIDNRLVLISVVVNELEQVVGRWDADRNEWEIGNDAITWDYESDSYMIREVVAWQPLPESYKL